MYMFRYFDELRSYGKILIRYSSSQWLTTLKGNSKLNIRLMQ